MPKLCQGYRENGKTLYDLSRDDVAKSVVDKMKANSAAWFSANESGRKDLSEENNYLAQTLEDYLGEDIYRKSDGVWWIGDEELFEKYKYHTGGIVGNIPTLKDKEILAKLEEGELVLDQKKKDVLYDKLIETPVMLESEQYLKKYGISSTQISKVASEGNLLTHSIGEFTNQIQRVLTSAIKDYSIGSSEYKIDKIEITAPVNVVQKLDKEELKKHADMIGGLATDYIMEGFQKRGKKKKISLF